MKAIARALEDIATMIVVLAPWFRTVFLVVSIPIICIFGIPLLVFILLVKLILRL